MIIPKVSVITTVGWDHMKYLGDTLAKIAQQKAGIIKHGVPVVIGKLPAEALNVITADAQEKKAPLYKLGADFTSQKLNGHQFNAKIRYQDQKIKRGDYELGLGGDYQVENAAIAVMAVEIFMEKMSLPLDRHSVATGLAIAKWPGRMETINDRPLVLLDGAHNLPGIQALVKTIKDDFADREVYVLVAILADKQYELMLGELASLGNVHIVLTRFAGPGPQRPSADLTSIMDEIPTKYPVKTVEEWQLAIGQIAGQMSEEDVMIITGSLYFISDVRKFLKNKSAKVKIFRIYNIES